MATNSNANQGGLDLGFLGGIVNWLKDTSIGKMLFGFLENLGIDLLGMLGLKDLDAGGASPAGPAAAATAQPAAGPGFTSVDPAEVLETNQAPNSLVKVEGVQASAFLAVPLKDIVFKEDQLKFHNLNGQILDPLTEAQGIDYVGAAALQNGQGGYTVRSFMDAKGSPFALQFQTPTGDVVIGLGDVDLAKSDKSTLGALAQPAKPEATSTLEAKPGAPAPEQNPIPALP